MKSNPTIIVTGATRGLGLEFCKYISKLSWNIIMIDIGNKAFSVYVILESPLLFETKQDSLTDTTLVIDSPIELQIKRASKRDQTSEEAIKKIINSLK